MAETCKKSRKLTGIAPGSAGAETSDIFPTNRQRTKKWSWIFILVCASVVVTLASGRVSAVEARRGLASESDRVKVRFLGFINDRDTESRVWLQIEGRFDPGTTGWRVTADPSECSPISNDRQDGGHGSSSSSNHQSVATVPVLSSDPASSLAGKDVYVCSKKDARDIWTLVGHIRLPLLKEDLIVNSGRTVRQADYDETGSGASAVAAATADSRQRRQSGDEQEDDIVDSSGAPLPPTADAVSGEPKAQIFAIMLDKVTQKVTYEEDGVINAYEGYEVFLTLSGMGLTNYTQVYLVSAALERGENCHAQHFAGSPGIFNVTVPEVGQDNVATMHIPPNTLELEGAFYMCVKDNAETEDETQMDLLIHQGTRKNVQIIVLKQVLPTWIKIVFLGILLCLSGLFSGLNLGLMALDQTELRIVQNTGDEKERDYANKIFPIRKHGNYLLCSLLLGNVLVNNSLTILLDTLTSGLVAIIGSTLGIVIFGEIVPQSICSRYALAVGANTIWCTKFFMIVTFPLSFPISKLLDKILGDEIGTVYDKKKLIELLKVTDANHDLEKEEVDIVTGALKYKEKSVKNIMTRIEDCYMLQLTSVLNFETVSEIRDQGYSRIPVYDKERSNIVHILFAKDLMFIDPDDNMPLAMVCEFYNNDVNFVFHDTPLNVMFNEFKSGEKGHMAFVQDVNNSGDGDPYYETIGLVTLEDIIEEIIQQEIVDETDVVVDNRTKKRRKKEKAGNFAMISGNPAVRKVQVSPQLNLAVFQYLTTQVDPFKPDHLEEMVLKKLLSLDIYREIKYKSRGKVQDDEDLTLMKKGKPVNYFILIVEGRVQVSIGAEELVFEAGPFSFYGIKALTQITQSMLDRVGGGVDGGGGARDGSAAAAANHMMTNVSSANALMESPSSPFATRSALSMNSVNSKQGEDGTATPATAGVAPPPAQNAAVLGAGGKQLRKASTRDCLETANIPGLQKRPSMVSATATGGGGGLSTSASASDRLQQFVFVPDYTVKAMSDVLYVRITRTTYMRAIKASLMATRKQSSSIGAGLLSGLGFGGGGGAASTIDTIEKELDSYLDRVNEDDLEGETLMATPMARSPDRSAVRRNVGGVVPEEKKPMASSESNKDIRQTAVSAAASDSVRKQPGQTISSPQSGSNNDELPTSVDDKAVGAAAGSSARDDFWDEGGAGGEDATRPPRDLEEGAGGETTKCDD